MPSFINRLRVLWALTLLVFLAGQADSRLHLKPMHCHKVEMHGMSHWTLPNKADCAVGIFSCWYVNVSRPVPNFAQPAQSTYFKGDCGTCPANEKSCVTCSEPYCNFKKTKSPRVLYHTDLMNQLSYVWVRRLTPFEYRLRRSREAKGSSADDFPRRPKVRVTVSSDFSSKESRSIAGLGAACQLLPLLLLLADRVACTLV